MLCNICQSLEFDVAVRDLIELGCRRKHHASYRDLFNSARAGCEFCTTIWQRDLVKKRQDPNNYVVSEPDVDSEERRWADGEVIAKAEDENEDWAEGAQIFWVIKMGSDRGKLYVSQPGFFGNLNEEFYFWVKTDDPLSEVFEHTERYVEPDPSSDASLFYETHWHERCQAEHTKCPPEQDYPLPTRVLDLKPADGSENPFLFISKGKLGKWVALSHCWGGQLPVSTTNLTLEAHQAGIPLGQLPQTFRDAVVITKRLGFQYLWIDSLCIIQDSKTDWAYEASRMGLVYKHAALTISANVAANCHAGILQQRDYEPVLELPYKDGSTNTSGRLQVRTTVLPQYDTGTYQKPEFNYTAQRGWILQEDRLSPRTLLFTRFGKQWICHEAHWDERRPIAGAMRFDSPDTPNKVNAYSMLPTPSGLQGFGNELEEQMFAAINLWYHIVAQFLERDLTYKTDCFPSLSGLTREVQKILGWTYRAGIWMEDVAAGLLWAVGGLGLRTDTYIAPSWSWASLTLNKSSPEYENLTSPQIYQYRPYLAILDPEFSADNISASVTNTYRDPYGTIDSASLTLRGLWKDANNDIFLSAMRQDPNYYGSRICFPESRAYQAFDPIAEGHPLFNFDCLSREEFDKEQESFKEAYDEKLGKVPDEKQGLWSRMSFVQICKAAPGMPIEEEQEQEQEEEEASNESFAAVHYALILEQTGTQQEFRRIGVAVIPEGMGSEGWVRREVKIV